ncbi:hypothetical protein [Pedobacter metabolipauper]|uniref:Glycosyltransferase family 61 protein n=1 Tax=Pedobacter metabolipauper TaxID=425513 RepID=A0A4V6PW31_9SPHI|nr:hypothetical protein [Pedobacter metabolipauper]TDQ12003.1 hypothetical protein ATK78_1133 [Pedobacter metabolipauper]
MFKKILLKVLGLFVIIRYPNVPKGYRYFYRDTYICQLTQLKYIFKDYIVKKPYKKICFSGEFTPDIAFALPFAYWHFNNGTLLTTEGAKYTNELYFFSPSHTESFDTRTTEGNYNFETPRILYSQDYNMSKWTPVPLKAMYKNDIYVYSKPILIVANRYNMEWDGPPVSFLSVAYLEILFNKYKDKYQIIYNRPRPENITNDNSDIYDLNEYEWIEENYPDIILMENLFKENKGKANNFNHLQMMVYANADHFVSTHGGTGALASYFGGVNIILSKKGGEHHFDCFHKLYTKLSGAKMFHAKTEEEVTEFLEENY